MKFTEVLLSKVENIWDKYIKHPFITGMADGSLDIEKFKYYMLQDYIYLKDYMKVFAVSLSKADDFELMKFLCDNMYAILDEIFKVHIPYMKELGITNENIKNAKPHIDNISYTKYMLCEAQLNDVLTGLVAILSCSWSYAYISKTIVAKDPKVLEEKNYGNWFKGYYSSEYQNTNNLLIETIDKLGANLSDVEMKKLCDVFVNASIYERKFWDMAYSQGK